MGDTELVRCAACALTIATKDGHYHLPGGHYHPECYDRKQVAALPRTIWPRPPLHTPAGARASPATMQ